MAEALTRTDTRRKLLEAAEKLIGKRGFHKTQVSDITDAAGVSTGVFYRYFKDKEEILYQLLDEYFTSFLDVMRMMRRSVNQAPPPEKVVIIRRLFTYAFTYHLNRPGVFLCWFRHGHGVSPAIDVRILGFISDLESIVAADIRGSTLIRAPDPDTLAQCIVAMATGLIQRMIEMGAPDVETAVDQSARFLAAGLIGYAPPEVYAALRTLEWPGA
jgi:AcrR family transcriptional regulator